MICKLQPKIEIDNIIFSGDILQYLVSNILYFHTMSISFVNTFLLH